MPAVWSGEQRAHSEPGGDGLTTAGSEAGINQLPSTTSHSHSGIISKPDTPTTLTHSGNTTEGSQRK